MFSQSTSLAKVAGLESLAEEIVRPRFGDSGGV